MSRFKIGQVLYVRPNLQIGTAYNGCVFVHEMRQFLGKRVTIACIASDVKESRYHIKEDPFGWYFSDDMFMLELESGFINLCNYI